MSESAQKVCFVVMGFGKKTDHESGRTLDLDATYDAIIRPAAEAENLRCIRADEIMHSGIIDTPMYEMLLRAELVVADISTGNVNAVYELGVRHALRPNATIIMTEVDGRLSFDLNHVSTFKYKHLGEDIGVKEANRAKQALQLLISAALAAATPDSPVYTYLPRLQQPKLTLEEYQALLDESEIYQENLAKHIHTGSQELINGEFAKAVEAFTAANEMKPNDSYILQQLTLATYKREKPGKITALINSLKIIERLSPNRSNDPETLGLTGAIHKRLWLETKEAAQLDLAINFYGRGFDIRRDYYNGENLALCYDYRTNIQHEENEKLFDKMSAIKTRETIVKNLFELMADSTFDDRSDKKWIFATIANCLFALSENERGNAYEAKFYSESPALWEINTYEDGKSQTQKIKASKPNF